MDTSMGYRRTSSYLGHFVLDAGLYVINQTSAFVTVKVESSPNLFARSPVSPHARDTTPCVPPRFLVVTVFRSPNFR